jgi:AcrR family transcriptional regulator
VLECGQGACKCLRRDDGLDEHRHTNPGVGAINVLLKRNEEQKQANRSAILTGGMLVFKDKGYADTSVEDILVRAEISRATFYKHFKSKISLAKSLIEEMLSLQENAYNIMAPIDDPTEDDIVAWLNALKEVFRNNQTLLIVLAELHGAEPQLRSAVAAANQQRIRRLSRSFFHFPPGKSGEDLKGIAHDRALLLMAEMDTVLVGLAIGVWKIREDVAIAFLAGQIRHFIDDNMAMFERAKRRARGARPEAV